MCASECMYAYACLCVFCDKIHLGNDILNKLFLFHIVQNNEKERGKNAVDLLVHCFEKQCKIRWAIHKCIQTHVDRMQTKCNGCNTSKCLLNIQFNFYFHLIVQNSRLRTSDTYFFSLFRFVILFLLIELTIFFNSNSFFLGNRFFLR